MADKTVVNRKELLRQINLIRVAIGSEEIPAIVPGDPREPDSCGNQNA